MRLDVAATNIVDMNRTGYPSSRSVAALHGDPAPVPSRSISRVLVLALLAGLFLGPVDLLAQTTLPYPWANLANSGAGWALGAFVIGMRSRQPARQAATAGMIVLVVAVESYYLATVIFLHDSTTTLWSEPTALWLGLAVLVGAIFGVAGSLIHSVRPGVRFAAVALASLIFLTEAVYTLARSSGSQSALIEIALAVIVALVLLTFTRHRPNNSEPVCQRHAAPGEDAS